MWWGISVGRSASCADRIGQIGGSISRRVFPKPLPKSLGAGLLVLAVLTTCADAAHALCTVAADPNTIDCSPTVTTDSSVDVTTLGAGGTTADLSDRHYIYTADGDVDAEVTGAVSGKGLAVTTTQGGAAILFENTGSISLLSPATAGGTAALDLNTNGGNIAYSGTGTIGASAGTSALDLDAGTGDVEVTIGSGGGISASLTAISGNTLGAFDISNSGTINGALAVSGTDVASSDFLNGGIWNATGLSNYSGNLENLTGGIIDMANGVVGDMVTIDGNYKGGPGSIVTVDVDLAGGTSDVLTFLEALSGTTIVTFQTVSLGFIKNPIVVINDSDDIDTDPGDQFIGDIPDYGIISYSFDKLPGGDWALTSSINDKSAASVLTNLTGALGNVTAGFHEPASNDVRCTRKGTVNQFCSGLWTRGNGARHDLSSKSQVAYNTRDLGTIDTEQRLSYAGLQSGIDAGVLNINGSGWEAHLGVTGGQIWGGVDQIDGKVGETDFDLPFVGVYAILSNGKFTLDLTARKEFYNIEFTNSAAGLDKKEVEGEAESYNATANYAFALGQTGAALIPFAAVTYSQTDIDDFTIIGGTISPGEEETLMVRAGARLAAIVKLTDKTYLQPFAGVSAWKNYKNETDAEFHTVNDALITSETESPDSFLQVEAGLGTVDLSNNFSGYVRGIYRDGDDVSGYGVTLGGRFDLSALGE